MSKVITEQITALQTQADQAKELWIKCQGAIEALQMATENMAKEEKEKKWEVKIEINFKKRFEEEEEI